MSERLGRDRVVKTASLEITQQLDPFDIRYALPVCQEAVKYRLDARIQAASVEGTPKGSLAQVQRRRYRPGAVP